MNLSTCAVTLNNCFMVLKLSHFISGRLPLTSRFCITHCCFSVIDLHFTLALLWYGCFYSIMCSDVVSLTQSFSTQNSHLLSMMANLLDSPLQDNNSNKQQLPYLHYSILYKLLPLLHMSFDPVQDGSFTLH